VKITSWHCRQGKTLKKKKWRSPSSA